MRNMPNIGECLLKSKVQNESQLVLFQKLRKLIKKAIHMQELTLSKKMPNHIYYGIKLSQSYKKGYI